MPPPIGELCVNIISGITIEPAMFLYFITLSISSFGSNNLIIQKACHPNATVEPDYSVPCPDEAGAQKLVTNINTWRATLDSFVPLIFIVFLGSWSDTHGKRRRPLVIIPIVGEVLRAIALIVCVRFWDISPAITTVLEAGLRGLSGGTMCFLFGANLYITDMSSVEDRTVRIGIINALAFIGSPIGILVGGVLRMKLGFYNMFLLCLVINVITLILAFILIKNTMCTESKLSTFEGLFDPTQFVQSIKTIIKKREGNKRLIVYLMAPVAPLFLACFLGEFAVGYFFVRYKFAMDEVDYGHFCAFKLLTIFFGSFVSLIICSKLLKMSDASIGCLGTFTQIASAVGLCFSENRWQLYFFSVVDLMHGAAGTASKSIISKVVEGNELGQIFSVVGALDVLVSLIVFPMFNMFYKLTFQFLPGAFYLLSVTLALIYFFLFFSVYLVEKKERKFGRKVLNEKIEGDKKVDVPLL